MSKRHKGKPTIRADEWKGEWQPFLDGYKVYPGLTRKLDSPSLAFDQGVVNEIVLWKLGRFAELPESILRDLNGLRALGPGQHQKGAAVLGRLLEVNGVRLPMASTFLRFANPEVFQIFDRHIWRALYGTTCPALSKKAADCSPLYLRFIDDLWALCGRIGINFRESDRILFEFDKKENPPLSETP